MRLTYIRLLTCVVAMFLFVGCKKKAGGDGKTILIGEYGSMTGPQSTFGQSTHNGLTMAIEEINAKGGVLGKPLEVINADDRSDANEAVTAVQKLISRDGVCAVIGEVASKLSMAAGGVCQREKIPMVSPASTNPDVTKGGDYLFRICFTDDFQGAVCARFADKMGWKRVAIFTDIANDYSKGLTKGFKDDYKGRIVVEENFRAGDNDFKAQLTKMQNANPDAVFVPGYYTEVCKIVRQARGIGLDVPFFGGDGWDSAETLKLGSVANGCYFANHYSADDPRPEVQQFVSQYKSKYRETPDAMAILGYDAGRVLAEAIKRAGKADPKAIRDALATIKDFPGASGTITIDANRNARKPAFIVEIRDGQTHKVETIMP